MAELRAIRRRRVWRIAGLLLLGCLLYALFGTFFIHNLDVRLGNLGRLQARKVSFRFWGGHFNARRVTLTLRRGPTVQVHVADGTIDLFQFIKTRCVELDRVRLSSPVVSGSWGGAPDSPTATRADEAPNLAASPVPADAPADAYRVRLRHLNIVNGTVSLRAPDGSRIEGRDLQLLYQNAAKSDLAFEGSWHFTMPDKLSVAIGKLSWFAHPEFAVDTLLPRRLRGELNLKNTTIGLGEHRQLQFPDIRSFGDIREIGGPAAEFDYHLTTFSGQERQSGVALAGRFAPETGRGELQIDLERIDPEFLRLAAEWDPEIDVGLQSVQGALKLVFDAQKLNFQLDTQLKRAGTLHLGSWRKTAPAATLRLQSSGSWNFKTPPALAAARLELQPEPGGVLTAVMPAWSGQGAWPAIRLEAREFRLTPWFGAAAAQLPLEALSGQLLLHVAAASAEAQLTGTLTGACRAPYFPKPLQLLLEGTAIINAQGLRGNAMKLSAAHEGVPVSSGLLDTFYEFSPYRWRGKLALTMAQWPEPLRRRAMASPAAAEWSMLAAELRDLRLQGDFDCDFHRGRYRAAQLTLNAPGIQVALPQLEYDDGGKITAAPLTLTVTQLELAAWLKQSAAPLPPLRSALLNGHVSIQSPDHLQSYRLHHQWTLVAAGIDAPLHELRLQSDGELVFVPGRELTVPQLRLQIDGDGGKKLADLHGRGRWPLAATELCEFDLTGRTLDTLRLYPFFQTAPNAATPTAQPGAATAPKPWGFDLGERRFRGTFALGNVTYGEALTNTLQGRVSGAARLLKLDELAFTANHQKLHLNGELESIPGAYPRFRLEASSNSIALQPLCQPWTAVDLHALAGTVRNFALQCSGEAAPSEFFWNKFNAEIGANFESILLPEAVTRTYTGGLLLLPLKIYLELQQLLPNNLLRNFKLHQLTDFVTDFYEGRRNIEFSHGVAALTVRDGVFTINDVRFQGEPIQELSFNGGFSPTARGFLKLTARVDFGELVLPLSIAGNITRPQVDLRRTLSGFAAANTLGNLSRLLPNLKNHHADASSLKRTALDFWELLTPSSGRSDADVGTELEGAMRHIFNQTP